ncbi:Protein of unknown function, partial [Cotesia congregata]
NLRQTFLTGYRLPAVPWSWLGAAAPSAAAAAAVAAAAVTPSPAAAPLVLAPRAAARRSSDVGTLGYCSKVIIFCRGKSSETGVTLTLNQLAVACSVTAAALRGVAIQRGRVGPATRAAFPAGAALALARNPGPLAAAAAATALHPFASTVYYDPFLAAHAATQDPNYRLQN